MFGIDRNDLPGACSRGHQGPTDDEGFLVGERDGSASLERRKRGRQTDRARDAVHHDIAIPAGNVGRGRRPGEDRRRPVTSGLVAPLLGSGVAGELQLLRRRRAVNGHHLDTEFDRLGGKKGDALRR